MLAANRSSLVTLLRCLKCSMLLNILICWGATDGVFAASEYDRCRDIFKRRARIVGENPGARTKNIEQPSVNLNTYLKNHQGKVVELSGILVDQIRVQSGLIEDTERSFLIVSLPFSGMSHKRLMEYYAYKNPGIHLIPAWAGQIQVYVQGHGQLMIRGFNNDSILNSDGYFVNAPAALIEFLEESGDVISQTDDKWRLSLVENGRLGEGVDTAKDNHLPLHESNSFVEVGKALRGLHGVLEDYHKHVELSMALGRKAWLHSHGVRNRMLRNNTFKKIMDYIQLLERDGVYSSILNRLYERLIVMQTDPVFVPDLEITEEMLSHLKKLMEFFDVHHGSAQNENFTWPDLDHEMIVFGAQGS